MAASLRRDPKAAASERYDLIVVGGGAHGACVAFEAARRGLRPLLLERGDYGAATSSNTLRILHGGLRYLQRLDFRRFFESVRERTWFLQNFPDLVRPLGCLMPLYGRGLRRPLVFRAALAVNNYLSRHRNAGVPADRHVPPARVLTPEETAACFPGVDREGLRGGALWYDAVMESPQRLLIELLRWAAHCGATALNYVEATRPLLERGRVVGLEAVDREAGAPLRFHAPAVINCAGPWGGRLAREWDRDVPGLFRPSLAFNLLLDREPLAPVALAVTARPSGPTFFLLPLKGRTLAGTCHVPWPGEVTRPEPSPECVEELLEGLNQAVPSFGLSSRDVMGIHAGFLPAVRAGSARAASRPVIHDHGAAGGPKGLFSVSGVKFTTARSLAGRVLSRVYRGQVGRACPGAPGRPPGSPLPELGASEECRVALRRLVAEEGVVHLDDLLLRRTGWADRGEEGRAVAAEVCDLLGWGGALRAHELARLEGASGRPTSALTADFPPGPACPPERLVSRP